MVRPNRVLIGLSFAWMAACDPVGGPEINRVEPTSARRGTSVVIYGTGFCEQQSNRCVAAGLDVTFGLEPQVGAVVLGFTSTTIEVVVPSSIVTGPTDLLVTVGGRSSNTVSFEVLP